MGMKVTFTSCFHRHLPKIKADIYPSALLLGYISHLIHLSSTYLPAGMFVDDEGDFPTSLDNHRRRND